MDFNFTAKLLLYFGLLELGLVDDLEGNDESGSPFPRQIDVAEFSFAQRPTDFKVFQAPALLLVITTKFCVMSVEHYIINLLKGHCVCLWVVLLGQIQGPQLVRNLAVGLIPEST